MKIGLVIYGSLDTVSGGFLYDRKLVEHLRSAGDTVEILSLPWRNYPRHLLDNLSCRVNRQIRASGLDLLLQDELNHPSLIACNHALRSRAQVRIVSVVHHLRADEHHPAPLIKLYSWVERRYLRSVDGFVYNSKTTRDRVAAHLLTPPRGVVAYPAADHLNPPSSERILDLAASKYAVVRPLNVLFVGNIIERKGLHLLVAALRNLPPQSWRLEIAGSLSVAPAYAASIDHAAHDADLCGQVTMHGAVSKDRLKQLLFDSDVLAVPSYEGFGIVYLEAMAYGVPVIATAAGAAHEIVTDGDNGYLVPPNDVSALEATLAHCIQNRQSLLPLSRAARRRYDQHPTWEGSAERVRIWLHEFAKR